MPDIETLRALEARVRAASGADRELDLLLWHDVHGERRPRSGFQVNMSAVPKFTASLDAAVALVERCLPGGSWTAAVAFFCPEAEDRPFFGDAASKAYIEDLDGVGDGAFGQAGGSSPALALCTALIRALIATSSEKTDA